MISATLAIYFALVGVSLGEDYLRNVEAIEAFSKHENIKGLIFVVPDEGLNDSIVDFVQESRLSVVMQLSDLDLIEIAKQSNLGIFIDSVLPMDIVEQASGRGHRT